MAPVPSKRTKAASPFDNTTADIVLHTSDAVDFHVRSHILLEASPVFASIRSIPQGPVSSDGPATIDLSEDSVTMETLLRICYPVANPTLRGRPLDEMERATHAALKYEMAYPLDMLCNELKFAAKKASFEVWAIACRCGLEAVATHAAREMLALPSTFYLDEELISHMAGVNAGDLYRLLEFHRLKGSVGVDFRLLRPMTPQTPEKQPGTSSIPRLNIPLFPYLPVPDLVCQSADNVEFRVHQSILAVATTSILEIPSGLPETPATSVIMTISEPNPPPAARAIQLDVPARILAPLLQQCYTGITEFPSDPVEFAHIIQIAQKYNMSTVIRTGRSHWTSICRSCPLAAYFVAVMVGPTLEGCAQEAAKMVLDGTLYGVYLPIMEHGPAVAYRDILQFYWSCTTSTIEALQDLQDTLAGNLTAVEVCSSWIGRGLDPTWSMDLERQRYDWLKSHIDGLVTAVRSCPRPGQPTLGGTSSIFEKATSAELYCCHCQRFAENMTKLAVLLRDLPQRTQQVALRDP